MVERQDDHEVVIGENFNGGIQGGKIASEVAMREHGALLATGGAGGVDERSRIVSGGLMAVIGRSVAAGLLLVAS